jgi:ferredoxin/flavodoxin---NADP+ reductase
MSEIRQQEHRAAGSGYEVLANVRLSPNVNRLEIRARRIANIRRPGQFVIVHVGPGAERIPLTIADANEARGSIALIVQAVGKSTGELVSLVPGRVIQDVVGPLGRPTELIHGRRALCVGGGVGTAVLYPIAQALQRLGTPLTIIVGARSKVCVLLEDEMAALGELVICTDDGSGGRPGLVTAALADALGADHVSVVYAAGPVLMMRAVADLTRPLGIRTIVSLDPIMLDGTGMCGGCRVTVGGKMRFACVDGPEFDGHEVDFDELADRLTTYSVYEREALARSASPAT